MERRRISKGEKEEGDLERRGKGEGKIERR